METKTLIVREALTALEFGEKVASDGLVSHKFINKCNDTDMLVYEDSDLVVSFGSLQVILNSKNLRIYQEFTYPMWFKNIENQGIVEFSKLQEGKYVTKTVNRTLGEVHNKLTPHTNTEVWEKVEEPKKMIKVAKYARRFKGKWSELSTFCKDDEDFKEVYPESFKDQAFKRLDYTEIEVEDY